MSSPTPPAGATSAAAVARQLTWSEADQADATKLEQLAPTVAAVNELVERMATTGPASRALGATMLAARVWRRRQSPEGVATYTEDGAVLGAARSDPEVWMLLGLGKWAPPVVG